MKTNKSDEIQINISVIGLSGSENVKGTKGIGKSCLCNRLSQPDFYKQKHSSIISSTDFYGSTFNQSHWLYWSYINKEIRGKKYKFYFIEQTIFIDDSSFREFKSGIEPQDYIKRASMTELRTNKVAYTCDQKRNKNENILLNNEDKFPIHLFLLLFDVSDVEKRNIKNQETIFKQLFDAVILSKKPIIIITTKHDIASQSLSDKLKSIIEKRPYNKYPIIETSAKLDINIAPIYDMVASLCDNSLKNGRQTTITYSDAYIYRQREIEQYKSDFKKIIEQTLMEKNVFMPWGQFRLIDAISVYRRRLSDDDLEPIFQREQQDLLLKKRGFNNRQFKEILRSLLKEFDHLIPLNDVSTETIIQNLKNDSAFISNFIDFNREMECFQFDQNCSNCKLIPLCLLDPNYENNLLFFIEEYVKQKSLEYQLYQHLLENSQKYFKKSMKEIREDLTRFIKYFIQDKVVKNVYDKFHNYYMNNLQRKFLDIIHEKFNLFLSQTILKIIDSVPHKSWSINGSTPIINKSFVDKKTDENSFVNKLIKEVNKIIYFEDLTILEDENNVREHWLRDFISFFMSKNEKECIIENVYEMACNIKTIRDVLIKEEIDIQVIKEELLEFSHMFYITIIGNSANKSHFASAILSRLTNLPLKICKVHSMRYEVEIVPDMREMKNLANGLDSCSICCIIILVDAIGETDLIIHNLEKFLSDIEPTISLVKYIMYNTDHSLNGFIDSQLLDLIERNKYTIKPLCYDNQHQAIDFIMSSAQISAEQNVIWIVTVCGDTYDYPSLIRLLMGTVKDFLLPMQSDQVRITINGSTNEIILHNYRLVFLSYHQVITLMIQSSSPPTVDAMLFVCSTERLASINTCLSIKKYLPTEIISSCHFMLLGVGKETHKNSEQIKSKSIKYGMECGFYDFLASDDSNEDIKLKLLNFFKGIINQTGTLESWNSIASNSTSSATNTSKFDDSLFRYLNKTMCQTCSDSYRSEMSVCANYSSSNVQNVCSYKSGSFDQVLGDTNENVFYFWSPEFAFDGAQDICYTCTKVNCDLHSNFEIQKLSVKPFRTRIRSQSGPDLRNPVDFNQISSGSSDMASYCSICGQDINKTQLNHSNRQSFRLIRQDGIKETTQKTFTAKLHDLFSPIKKIGESQLVDSKKLFTRSSSKRHK